MEVSSTEQQPWGKSFWSGTQFEPLVDPKNADGAHKFLKIVSELEIHVFGELENEALLSTLLESNGRKVTD